MRKYKILFLYLDFSSFIKNDYDILKKHFDVTALKYVGKRSIPKIIANVYKHDLCFSWFGGHHSAIATFFAKIFGKKSIIVAGGIDCACVPEINYGVFIKPLDTFFARFAFKHANKILAVSKFTKNELLKRVKPKCAELVYNGVDIKRFKLMQEKEIYKETNLVITVSGINWSNLKRKGIETFVKSAKLIPEARFVVIGKFMDNSINHLKSIASPNVEFTDFVSDKDLIKWYQKAKVICQLSYYEAFGLAPAEGMACGCIPVVTKERVGLSEVVGDTGFYVPYNDTKATADAIKKALSSSEKGKMARERINEMFSIEKREKELINIVGGEP
ncbi:MAG: glycosyltransferase family 4 protein [Thermoplasmatales archaeon]|nr:glycosyltransferase family 4 protein [Candidatus Thermoplasmatota archaeon]MCG2826789.1 glycosyltransferase family 4 protein [Thermoplasmatales archaeon]